MTDDMDRLKSALKDGAPSPDPQAKARALAAAQKSFAARQGSQADARPIHNRRKNLPGFVTGVKDMFANIGLRPSLYATSAVAVLGLGVVLVLPVTPPLEIGQGSAPLNVEKKDKARLQEENDDAVEREMAPAKAAKPAATTEQAISGLIAPAPLVTADAQAFPPPLADSEQFANQPANPLKITAEDPVSTFSIDVDTASYAYIRSAITGGTLPRPEAVRIEEMVNYFPYDYPAPQDGQPFSTSVSVFQTPWNKDTRLVHIGIQGELPALETRPPLDLVFLIDTSGSMQNPDKLPLLKQAFRLLLGRLGAEDRVSIVTYAGSSGVALPSTAASDADVIMASLDQLDAQGYTAGQAGLQLAYAQAEKMHEDGRIGRIILATDGDFNVGISNPDDLKKYVEQKREGGTFLSVLGFGRGNYNDALMQALAQNGNGTASYIDTLSEAQKVLVDQVSGALYPIANDVKIQVEFNPASVAEYRLLGYETRALAREDFNNDKVDAGDIGAGHTVTAIYEVTPVGSAAVLNDPLRYQTVQSDRDTKELGFLRLRYKEPGKADSHLIETAIANDTSTASTEARFAAAIAGFGQLLRDDTKYLGNWTYGDAIALANGARADDPFGYRAEAVRLMRLADNLSR